MLLNQTIQLDTIRQSYTMTSDSDDITRKQEDILQDEDLEYAHGTERQKLHARSIYSCDSEIAKGDIISTSINIIAGERVITELDDTVVPSGADVANDSDDTLPDLDLKDLWEEISGLPVTTHKPIDAITGNHLSECVLLSSLDLYGLFDDEENSKSDREESKNPSLINGSVENEDDISDTDVHSINLLDQLVDTENLVADDDEYWLDKDDVDETTLPVPEYNGWHKYETEVDEYQDDIKQACELDVDTDSELTKEERALQAAIDVGRHFDLDQSEIRMLAEIFEMNGWSACKVAVERELEDGKSVEELRLAADVKEIWQEHFEFYSDSATHYRVLSWPAALSIIHSFDGYPSLEEVDLLLEQLYDHWYHDRVAKKINVLFGSYVLSKFNPGLDYSALDCEWGVSLASYFDDEHFSPPNTCDVPLNAFQKDSHMYFADIRKSVD